MADDRIVSGYVQYLPAVLREDPLLGRILLAFEKVLVGFPAGVAGDPLPALAGIEAQLDGLARVFRPGPGRPDDARTPDAFVPWLAGWLGLSIRDDWDGETRRRFLANVVPLYRMRGTRAGLLALLNLYVDQRDAVTIHEFEAPPHFFQVEIVQSQRDPLLLARLDRVVRAIIDAEKPAHTIYGLRILFPTMQIVDAPAGDGDGIYVGVNTALGAGSFKPI
jgi:phage tail-like protein